jgi:hypothetical protein
MKKQNLLTGIMGGVLGFVGMIVALVQGKSTPKSSVARSGGASPGEKKSPERKGKEDKGKGQHLAMARKKKNKRQSTPKTAAPAKISEKGAPATSEKGAQNIAVNAPAKA